MDTTVLAIAVVIVGLIVWFMARKGRNVRSVMTVSSEKIVDDYGLFMETGGFHGGFIDASVLPYPKHKILDAIEERIVEDPDDERAEIMRNMAVFLADAQKGIGPDPFNPVGVTRSQWEESQRLMKAGDAKAAITMIASLAQTDRLNRLQKVANAERIHIMARMGAAAEMRARRQKGLT